ncbi:PAS domain S-box-containing protein [Methylobacterium sp. yr596]|nr:PAS domain S-box-containing protein [Methylobacterium sp. yr596]
MGRDVLFETTIEALRAHPAFGQRIAGADRAVLLLDPGAERVLYASPAAASLRDAIGDAEGRIDPALDLARQLRGAAGLPTGTAQPRLERLRFTAGRLAPPLLCACLPALLPDGTTGLAVAIVDPLPTRRGRRGAAQESVAQVPETREPITPALASAREHPAPDAAEAPVGAPSSQTQPHTQAPIQAPEAGPAPAEPRPAAGPGLRFLWRSDAHGLVIEATGRLSETVGASPVGQSWEALLAGPVEAEPALAEALARQRTFRAVPVRWRLAGTRQAVAVDLSGAPRLGAGRSFAGFSGFGVIHPERIVPAADRPEPAPPKPQRPSLRERAAAVIAVGRHAPGADAPLPGPARPRPVPPADAAPGATAETPDLASIAGATMAEFAGLMAVPFAQLGMSWGFAGKPSVRAAGAAPVPAAKPVPASEPVAPAPPSGETNAAPTAPEASGAGATDQATLREDTPTAEAAESDALPDTLPDAAEAADPAAADSTQALAPEALPPESMEPEFPAAQAISEAEAVQPPADGTSGDEASTAQTSAPDLSETPAPATGDPESPTGRAAQDESPSDEEAPHAAALTLNEHAAFREIARALGARFGGEPGGLGGGAPPQGSPGRGAVTPFRGAQALARLPERGTEMALARLVERLPVGILVHRGDEVLLANRHLLGLADYDTLEALAAAGGPGAIFRGRDPAAAAGSGEGAPIVLATRAGGSVPVGVSVAVVEWDGAPASVLTVRRLPDADPTQSLAAAEAHLAHRDAHLRETTAVLDAVTDGVVVLDDEGRVVGMNRGARDLLAADPCEVAGEPLLGLFAPESRPAAQAALLRASAGQTATTGEEVLARGPDGPLPVLLTLAPVATGTQRRVAAVLRDVSAFRRTEAELVRARREAERASAQKSDFLATISHEVRTPLNAIIGFAEVMLEEQFGPVGNERYRDYLRDIRSSGEHVVSLVNDLLDLAKIEAGHLDLAFAGLPLNDLVAASVALMQPQAARQRVVMRTSFAAGLPAVLADQRSLRQAVLNVISNAIKFTDAGGQVIVSTATTDRGGVALRVRDTGIGMNPEEVEVALQPFRQVATAQTRRGGGTGLGLPLTKALVEANRATLRLTSRKGEGTLVEVLFPAGRVLEA